MVSGRSFRAGSKRVVLVRIGLAGLAGLNLWWGVWAVMWPRPFFDTFPGFGHHWTAAYPPYNEHLVVDLGSTFLTLGFLLAVAAGLGSQLVRIVVLGGVLVFDTLHLVFHAGHRGTTNALDYGLSTAALIVGVLAPLALLLLDLTTLPHRGTQPRAGVPESETR